MQVIKHRTGYRLTGVTIRVVDGDPQDVCTQVGAHTAYVERTPLTSRQRNGRLVRTTLSFSQEVEMLTAACAWEDAVYNLTRPVKTLRLCVAAAERRWQPRSPAMAAGLTDHIWTAEELLLTVVAPDDVNTK